MDNMILSELYAQADALNAGLEGLDAEVCKTKALQTIMLRDIEEFRPSDKDDRNEITLTVYISTTVLEKLQEIKKSCQKLISDSLEVVKIVERMKEGKRNAKNDQ